MSARKTIRHSVDTNLYVLISIIGTLRSNDADGNENVIKTIGFTTKTTILHVHHARLYISLPVFARLRRENTSVISRFMEYVNKEQRNAISLSELGYGP